MIKGKCLCGAISYTLTSELDYLYHCHCNECRAFSGSSFATNAKINAADFTIYDPGNHLACFEPDGGKRYFCNNCGSPIYSFANGKEDIPSLHCGSIIQPPEKLLDANFWVSEKCPWTDIDATVANYEKFPPKEE